MGDGSGGAAAINRYDEFGKPQAGNAGRFQYTGQMWLGDVGLYHYKARAYAPHLGRFLQPDPIGYEDSPNLYAYVLNDPVNLVDPLGLDRWCVPGSGGYAGCLPQPPQPGDILVYCDRACQFRILMREQMMARELQWRFSSGRFERAGIERGGRIDRQQPKVPNCRSAARQIQKLASGASIGASTGAVGLAAVGAEPAAAALAGGGLVAGAIDLAAGIYIYRTEGDLGPLRSSGAAAFLGLSYSLASKGYRLAYNYMPPKDRERIGRYLMEMAPNAAPARGMCP